MTGGCQNSGKVFVNSDFLEMAPSWAVGRRKGCCITKVGHLPETHTKVLVKLGLLVKF